MMLKKSFSFANYMIIQEPSFGVFEKSNTKSVGYLKNEIRVWFLSLIATWRRFIKTCKNWALSVVGINNIFRCMHLTIKVDVINYLHEMRKSEYDLDYVLVIHEKDNTYKQAMTLNFTNFSRLAVSTKIRRTFGQKYRNKKMIGNNVLTTDNANQKHGNKGVFSTNYSEALRKFLALYSVTIS